jgi:hypothetical protein
MKQQPQKIVKKRAMSVEAQEKALKRRLLPRDFRSTVSTVSTTLSRIANRRLTLDDCHKLELRLRSTQRHDYYNALCWLTSGNTPFSYAPYGWMPNAAILGEILSSAITANVTQRREALCRVFFPDKWEGGGRWGRQ